MDANSLFPYTFWTICRWYNLSFSHESRSGADEIYHNEPVIFLQVKFEWRQTRIVYCKDSSRKENHEIISFDFLGYTFRPRKTKNTKTGCIFTGYLPGISQKSKNHARLENFLYYRPQSRIQPVIILWNPLRCTGLRFTLFWKKPA